MVVLTWKTVEEVSPRAVYPLLTSSAEDEDSEWQEALGCSGWQVVHSYPYFGRWDLDSFH